MTIAVDQRDNGTWRARWVTGVDAEGERVWKSHQDADWLEKDALRYALEREQEIELGLYADPEGMTLEEYLEQWLATYAKPNLRQTTYTSYRAEIERHIVRALGGLKLDKLRPLHLQQYLTHKLQDGRLDGKPGGLSRRTVRYHYAILNRALSQAVKWQLLARNPLEAVDRPKAAKPELQYWTEEQALQFLETNKDHWLFELVYLAITTGLRQGELFGLRWADLDLEKRTLQVKQQITRDAADNLVESEPKSDTSRRTIALSQQDVWALKRQRAKQAEWRLQAGETWADRGLVFSSQGGEPLLRSNVWRAFKAMMQSADVPTIRFHDLRHTHATLLVKGGERLAVVKERLGHADLQTTMQYTHLATDDQREIADELGKKFGGLRT